MCSVNVTMMCACGVYGVLSDVRWCTLCSCSYWFVVCGLVGDVL